MVAERILAFAQTTHKTNENISSVAQIAANKLVRLAGGEKVRSIDEVQIQIGLFVVLYIQKRLNANAGGKRSLRIGSLMTFCIPPALTHLQRQQQPLLASLFASSSRQQISATHLNGRSLVSSMFVVGSVWTTSKVA